jgi:hypothetical protein
MSAESHFAFLSRWKQGFDSPRGRHLATSRYRALRASRILTGIGRMAGSATVCAPDVQSGTPGATGSPLAPSGCSCNLSQFRRSGRRDNRRAGTKDLVAIEE